jgi:hypothetical protein
LQKNCESEKSAAPIYKEIVDQKYLLLLFAKQLYIRKVSCSCLQKNCTSDRYAASVYKETVHQKS